MKTHERENVELDDVLNNLVKYRHALGFIADRIEDAQASAAVHMIEEAMEVTEQMLSYIMQSDSEKQEDRQEG